MQCRALESSASSICPSSGADTVQSLVSHPEAPTAQHQLLQGFTQLLAPVRVDERIDERVTDDEDEEKVKVSEETVAEGAGGAGEDEDEVEEEGAPA